MNTRSTIVVIVALFLLAVGIGLYLYPTLPDRIATHWNAQGVADGYSVRFWGVFLMPMIMAALAALFLLIPILDPLRKNIESFRRYYNLFWVGVTGFMFYMFLLTLAYNGGYSFDFSRALIPGFAVLFWFVAILVQHAKRSWFVGIRTPWTMSDDIVWEKTHALGATLFKAAAILSLVGLFVGGAASILFLLVPALGASLIATVYSYLEYRKRH